MTQPAAISNLAASEETTPADIFLELPIQETLSAGSGVRAASKQ